MKRFLHIGCGQKRKDRTTRAFASAQWVEVRFDIDAAVQPDIAGTMTDMGAVPSASFDAVFSSHNIEHLYPHEVPVALSEFRRVLTADGVAIVTCPDLQGIAALVAEDRLIEPAYTSPAGPIAPLDMLYGHRPALARGNLYMAHRTGFTARTLRDALQQAGFAAVLVARRPGPSFDLWACASVAAVERDALAAVARAHFP